MAGDRARVSHDPSRKWRALVAQQGRVTVEADWNEATAIADEHNRLVTLDVVGAVGTPDNGYTVTAVPAGSSPPAIAGDLEIGPGTLYLGGERLDLDAQVTYSAQAEWLDYSTDPLWVAAAVPTGNGTSYELVYLLAFEQEVSAVEDPALADVALGGPDTMQRQRVLQHVIRQPSQSATCGDAWSGYIGTLASRGLQFDQASMMLQSQTTMQVSFASVPAASSRCQPVATGGYLGAENQMIRVMVSSVDAGVATVVWGFDDASFLYRVQAATYDSGSDTTTVTLLGSPVDSYHYPAAGQAVELLRDAVQLTAPNPAAVPPTTGDYIASAAGFVAPVVTAYNPTTMQLVISGQPPTDYLTAATPQLYLRVWQSTFTPTSGQAAELDGTGVNVTLTIPAGGSFHVGDFWRFALRPIQPAIVYPARYLDAPQPPDGPRTWACPLALLTWDAGRATGSDCVPPFGNLVGLTGLQSGCCTVDVSPSDLADGGSLQALLDGYANQGPITVCLQPGTYTLSQPLLLGSGYDGLTLQSCGGGVVMQAPSQPGAQFTSGLIVVQGAPSITISGIELSVPLVSFTPPSNSFSGLPEANSELMQTFSAGLQVAIGITASDTSGLVIEDCVFDFPDPGGANVFGAGIYAAGAVAGLTVTGCTFQSENPPETTPFYDLTAGNQTEPPYQLTFGYLQAAVFAEEQSSALLRERGEEAAEDEAAEDEAAEDEAAPHAAVPAQLLHDAAFDRSLFTGVTVPVLAVTQLGTLRIDQNTVRNSYGGFWLYSAVEASQLTLIEQVAIGNPGVFQNLAGIGAAAIAERIVAMAIAMAQVLPTTPPAGTTSAPTVTLAPSQVRLARARQLLATLYAQVGGAPVPDPARTTRATRAGRRRAAATATQKAVTDLPAAFGITFHPFGGEPTGPVIPPADTGTSVTSRLDLCDCQVDTVIAESYSGAGLLLADLAQTEAASALVHGNRLRSRFPAGETVCGLWLAEACVTGNIVANEVPVPVQPTPELPASYSISLVATASPLGAPAVAAAGNVLIGPPLGPAREWELTNTVISYSVVPSVTGVSPATGPEAGGTSVTISGAGFTAATLASFGPNTVAPGGTPAMTVDSDTQITATSPQGTGTVDITVTTPAGTSATSSADQFSYTAS